MFGALATMFSLLVGPAAAAYAKANKKTDQPLPVPTTISPQVTQTMAASRKRIASQKGRKSTLMTNGIFTTPSILKQGLYS